MSLLNYVPFVPTCLTCLCILRAYVPSCLKLLRAYVPSCLKLPLRAYVPTCLKLLRVLIFTCLRAYLPIHIFQAYVPSCHKLFRSYVRSFFTCLRENTSQNILRLTSILCIAVSLWIMLTLHSIKNPKRNFCF